MKAIEMRSMRPTRAAAPMRRREKSLKKNTNPGDRVEHIDHLEYEGSMTTGRFFCWSHIDRFLAPVKYPGVP